MMKYLLICSGLFLAVHGFGKNYPPKSLFDQLADVNPFWDEHRDVVFPPDPVAFGADRDVIRMHLQLVEKTLRERATDHLTSLQKANRLHALDVLHAYWQRGVFPQNIYHRERTPYFIDHQNTACAVGHLIIETGYDELAQEIALKDNYSLIENLHYPQLALWASDFGFEIAELKWIQPMYGPPCESSQCQPGEVRNVSCHGINDGCISAVDVISFGEDAYYYEGTYKLDIETQAWDRLPYACDLSGGQYRVTYQHTDSLWYWDQYYDLHEPEPIVIQTETGEDDENCLNSIQITVTGGAPPYVYEWSNGENGYIVNNLCPGIYDVKVTDANGCMASQVIPLGLSSSTSENPLQNVMIYPNPIVDELIIESLDEAFPVHVKIYNTQGVELINKQLISTKTTLNVALLPQGMYYVNVSNGMVSPMRRIVKVGN